LGQRVFGEQRHVTATTVDQLLSDPAAHHQRSVEVVGFFVFGREHVAIYPSAREAREARRGIWLVSPECAARGLTKLKRLNRSTVAVSGTFISMSKRGAGHFGGWSAELRRITRIEAVTS
jgi:hypothetical protein